MDKLFLITRDLYRCVRWGTFLALHVWHVSAHSGRASVTDDVARVQPARGQVRDSRRRSAGLPLRRRDETARQCDGRNVSSFRSFCRPKFQSGFPTPKLDSCQYSSSRWLDKYKAKLWTEGLIRLTEVNFNRCLRNWPFSFRPHENNRWRDIDYWNHHQGAYVHTLVELYHQRLLLIVNRLIINSYLMAGDNVRYLLLAKIRMQKYIEKTGLSINL